MSLDASALDVDGDGLAALVVAHSRKVQKGEDFDLAETAVSWTPARADGRAAGAVTFAVLGLFDGHGGKACAAHCAETFVPELTRALEASGPLGADEEAEDAFERRIAEALRTAFKIVDETFLARDVHSGSTATICVVRGRLVTTAAVGDSLATLELGPGVPVMRLSVEHRLDSSESERKRIEEAGGEVRPTEYEDGPNGERVGVGPLRVWPGGLAVSRSIGDRDGKKGGVISEPEVSMVLIPDRFHSARLVLASDGLWDAATPKQASACASKLNAQSAAAALNKLAQQQKDNRDDITVLVVDMLSEAGGKSGPFVTKPTHGEEKASLYFPFAKKAHEPFPLPSERRARRALARAEEEARRAALEHARQLAEAEAEAERLRVEAARAQAAREEEEDGWEPTGKGSKKKDIDRPVKPQNKEKKPKQKKDVKPKSETREAAPIMSPPQDRKAKRGKKSDLPLPDVSSLQIQADARSEHPSEATSAGEARKKATKKKKTKEKISMPMEAASQSDPPRQIVSPLAAVSAPPQPMLAAQALPVLRPFQPMPPMHLGMHGMRPHGHVPPVVPPPVMQWCLRNNNFSGRIPWFLLVSRKRRICRRSRDRWDLLKRSQILCGPPLLRCRRDRRRRCEMFVKQKRNPSLLLRRRHRPRRRRRTNIRISPSPPKHVPLAKENESECWSANDESGRWSVNARAQRKRHDECTR